MKRPAASKPSTVIQRKAKAEVAAEETPEELKCKRKAEEQEPPPSKKKPKAEQPLDDNSVEARAHVGMRRQLRIQVVYACVGI